MHTDEPHVKIVYVLTHLLSFVSDFVVLCYFEAAHTQGTPKRTAMYTFVSVVQRWKDKPLNYLFFIELLELPPAVRMEMNRAAADFLYNSMHDISAEVLNLKAVIFSWKVCKYF